MTQKSVCLPAAASPLRAATILSCTSVWQISSPSLVRSPETSTRSGWYATISAKALSMIAPDSLNILRSDFSAIVKSSQSDHRLFEK